MRKWIIIGLVFVVVVLIVWRVAVNMKKAREEREKIPTDYADNFVNCISSGGYWNFVTKECLPKL